MQKWLKIWIELLIAAAIPNLVAVLTTPNEEVQREAARALGNLAANIEFGDLILREGALRNLISHVEISGSINPENGIYGFM